MAKDPAWLCSLKPAEWKVLVILYDAMNETGEVRMSLSELGRRAGITGRHNTRDALRRLVQDGAIGRKSTGEWVSHMVRTGTSLEESTGTHGYQKVVRTGTSLDAHISSKEIRTEALRAREAPSSRFPDAETLLRSEGATERTLARVLALPCLHDLVDGQVCWLLRTARKPNQRSAGLYLHTIPELVALEMRHKREALLVKTTPKCVKCMDIGRVSDDGMLWTEGETLDSWLDRSVECGCQGPVETAHVAPTFARVGPTWAGRLTGPTAGRNARGLCAL